MKLAQVVEIDQILPHGNADTLEVARVKGWHMVVKKGQFASRDKAIFIPIDTIVPEREEFEFLRSLDFRVRTCKLRGHISEGLLMPVSILGRDAEVGEDVANELGVVKYEKPLPEGMDAIGAFPVEILNKTDEDDIQFMPEVIELLKGEDVFVSVKVDGCSMTAFMDPERGLRVCSRSLEFAEGNNLFWRAAKKFNLQNLPVNTAIQCEVFGEGIQKNPTGVKGLEIEIFNIFDIESRKHFTPTEIKEFCLANFLPMVKTYYVGIFKWESIEEMILEADKARYPNGRQAEGLVWRLMRPNFLASMGKPLSIKTVSTKYKLKHES